MLASETPGERLERYARALRAMENRKAEYDRLGVRGLAEMEAGAILRMRSAIKSEEIRTGLKAS